MSKPIGLNMNPDITFAAALVADVYGEQRSMLAPLAEVIDLYLEMKYADRGDFQTPYGTDNTVPTSTWVTYDVIEECSGGWVQQEKEVKLVSYRYNGDQEGRPVLYAISYDKLGAPREEIVVSSLSKVTKVNQLLLGRLAAFLDEKASHLPVQEGIEGRPSYPNITRLLNCRTMRSCG